MKRLLILFLFILPLHAQFVKQYNSTSAVSGGCSQNSQWIDSTLHTFSWCENGTWRTTGNINLAAPGAIGGTTPSTGAFTTLSVTGAVTSTLANGSAPFVLTSSTKSTNLNADLLDGLDSAVFAQYLTGTTGSVTGDLTIGTCDSGTATVTGATTAMSVIATPVTYPGDGVVWNGYVSSTNTVTVKECGLAIVTPTATVYNVRVIK